MAGARLTYRLRAAPALTALALGAVVALAGCGGGSDSDGSSGAGGTPEGGAGGSADQTIAIKDFAFVPKDLKATAGAKIVVKNEDSAVHTVTADDGSFDTGNVDPGAQKEIAVAKSGQISFKCNIHQYMTGDIQVSGP